MEKWGWERGQDRWRQFPDTRASQPPTPHSASRPKEERGPSRRPCIKDCTRRTDSGLVKMGLICVLAVSQMSTFLHALPSLWLWGDRPSRQVLRPPLQTQAGALGDMETEARSRRHLSKARQAVSKSLVKAWTFIIESNFGKGEIGLGGRKA